MTRFLDIPGASGASYRFRRVESGSELPVTAGNILAVDEQDGSPRFVCAATARSLGRAAEQLDKELKGRRVGALYIRLNVSTPVREAEHRDIVEAIRPAVVLTDLG